MTSRLPVALAVIGLVGIGALSTVLPATAKETSPKMETTAPKAENITPKIQTSAPKEDEQADYMPSPQDDAAFVDARMAALHAGLELTADQAKLWPPVEQALRDLSKLMYEQHERLFKEHHPLDPVARLKFMSANMITRGEAMKKVGDAADPLYAALTEAQKHRLPILLRAFVHPFGHGGHFGMMGAGPGFHMGPGMGHGWMDHGCMSPSGMGHGEMGHGPMMGGPKSNDSGQNEE